MLFYTAGQSAAFLLMLGCGLRLGLLWDFFRLLRHLFKPGFLLSLALDLLFGAAAAGLLCASLMRALEGELRLYALMGALCGFLLYGATLSHLLAWIAGKAAAGLRRAGQWLQRQKFVKKMLK